MIGGSLGILLLENVPEITTLTSLLLMDDESEADESLLLATVGLCHRRTKRAKHLLAELSLCNVGRPSLEDEVDSSRGAEGIRKA
jgi:hypothetical protein